MKKAVYIATLSTYYDKENFINWLKKQKNVTYIDQTIISGSYLVKFVTDSETVETMRGNRVYIYLARVLPEL